MIPISKAYVFAQINGEAIPLGVVQEKSGHYFFAYAKSWLARETAYAIDPVHLPLSNEIFSSSKIFDVLLDAGPDNWGKRVMAATHRQVPANPIEELIACRGSGAGNLLFSASRNRALPPRKPPTFDDLSELIQGSDLVEARESIHDDRLVKLLDYGSSMGGARPKTVIIHKGKEWLAKLNRRDDVFDNAKAELACLNMARDSGIRTPDTEFYEINGRSVLLVERFDRDGHGHRMHYMSAQAALGMHRITEKDFSAGYSYSGIAGAMRRFVSNPFTDARELYKRMLLNVGLHNTDDHLRNHGFLLDPLDPKAEYRLSPVFDVVPHGGSDLHAIGVGSEGRVTGWHNALSSYVTFGLSLGQAKSAYQEVADTLMDVDDYFLQAGLDASDIRVLMPLIDKARVISDTEPEFHIR